MQGHDLNKAVNMQTKKREKNVCFIFPTILILVKLDQNWYVKRKLHGSNLSGRHGCCHLGYSHGFMTIIGPRLRKQNCLSLHMQKFLYVLDFVMLWVLVLQTLKLFQSFQPKSIWLDSNVGSIGHSIQGPPACVVDK